MGSVIVMRYEISYLNVDAVDITCPLQAVRGGQTIIICRISLPYLIYVCYNPSDIYALPLFYDIIVSGLHYSMLLYMTHSLPTTDTFSPHYKRFSTPTLPFDILPLF